ncbi:uncharacterized protein LOC121726213 [Aricia agestis]|uniref:uncharacterized protein LOC121726213 n=1 Tax=Aricia agestis TaxID=91739 RepID=UPI001C201D16|nr:uncharacterized protein LOC121726213 [Aricia agestis]
METKNNCDTIFTKLIINEKPVFIKVLWEDSETIMFSIQFFTEDNSWQGKYTTEAAAKFMQRFKQTKEEYAMDVKSFLLKMNPMFKYDFRDNNEKATFSWKKKFEGSAVILHGSLEMEQSTDTKSLLIDSLIEDNQTLRNNLDISRSEIKHAETDLKRYQDKLEKLNNINSSLEETLLGKFVQLLNSKKKRIQLLEDALNNTDN